MDRHLGGRHRKDNEKASLETKLWDAAYSIRGAKVLRSYKDNPAAHLHQAAVRRVRR